MTYILIHIDWVGSLKDEGHHADVQRMLSSVQILMGFSLFTYSYSDEPEKTEVALPAGTYCFKIK